MLAQGAMILYLFLALSAPQVDTTEVLTDAVVTASRNTTIQVQKLEGETLKKLSSESVADALKYFSGVQIKDYGGVGGLKTVNVRSLGSQHTAIYYNGVRISNAQNGQVDLGRYSLDNVESVTLYNGQKSEVLQTASDVSSAASVYIQQKLPDKTETSIMLKSGSFETFNPRVYQSFAKGRFKVSLSADYLTTNGRYNFTYHTPTYDTTVVRHNGDIHAYRMEGLASCGGLKVSGYFYQSDRGLPGPVIRRVSDQYLTRDRQQDQDWFIQATYKKFWGTVGFQGVLKYSHNYVHYNSNVEQNAAAMPVDNEYKQNEVYASLAAAWFPLSWLSFGVSADERWADLDCNVWGFQYVQRFITLASANSQISWKGFKVQPSVLFTSVYDDTEMPLSKHTLWTPAVFITYDKNWFVLRAFYKEIFRLPTFNDLYYTTAGYRNLKPEYTKQLSGAVEFNKWGFTASCEVYQNRVWNKIVAMPIQNQFSWAMVNFGEVKGYGVSTKLGYAYSSSEWDINAFLTYTYEVAEDFTDSKSRWYRGQVPYTPWNSGSLIANFQYKTWGASLSYLYTGNRYRNVANILENRLSPWMTTDVSLFKDFSLSNKDVKVSVNLNNVFNQPYEVVTNYPMPGFNAFIKISLTI